MRDRISALFIVGAVLFGIASCVFSFLLVAELAMDRQSHASPSFPTPQQMHEMN